MSKVKFYREKLADANKGIQSIIDKCESESRGRTEEETTQYTKFKADKEEFRTLLVDAEELEKEAKDAAVATAAASRIADTSTSNSGEERELTKAGKEFKFLRAMQQIQSNKELSGVEKEMYEEAQNELRTSGQSLGGNIAIPSKLIKFGNEKRDLTVGVEGTNVVAEETRGLIPILAPNPVIVGMGAQTLTGLQGDLKFPRHSTAATLEWEGETDPAAETTPAFDKVEMSPNRVSGYIDVSQQLIRQSSFSMESFVRDELNRVLALEIDETSMNGTGTGDQPLGILNTVGIGDVGIGTNGGALAYTKVLELLSEVDTANALMGNLGFLTTPGVKYHAMDTPKQASGVEGNFIMNQNDNLVGYNVTTSTQMPSNLTKGTGTGLHALLFGNFNDWMIGQWGGVDLLVDPYTQATNGLLRFVINAYYDMKTRHPEGFAAIQDIDPS